MIPGTPYKLIMIKSYISPEYSSPCFEIFLGLNVCFAPEVLLNAKYDVQWQRQHLLISHHDHRIFLPREFRSIPEVDRV
jgi:hypothetical protein